MNVPYLDLKAQYQTLRAEVNEAIARAVESATFCLGPDVVAFEKEFAKVCGVQHAVGFNSGTSALHVAMNLLNVGAGDEVVTTPMTFVATSWAVSYVGAKIVYADIEDDTFNLDPAKAEQVITDKTKVLLPVHLYGHPCDVHAFSALSKKYAIPWVEDAAQAHLAQVDGKPVGSFGVMAGFSFYPGKNLGAYGEAGALVMNSEEHALRAKALREHGSRERYYHQEVGYNYRMEGIQGAVLGVKLRYLEQWTQARRKVASWYHELLQGADIRLPIEREGVRAVWHLFVVRHPQRDALKAHLEKHGVGCGIHYPLPLHLQECYKNLGYKRGAFPVAEKACDECLSLPIYPELTREQVEYVAKAIREFTG